MSSLECSVMAKRFRCERRMKDLFLQKDKCGVAVYELINANTQQQLDSAKHEMAALGITEKQYGAFCAEYWLVYNGVELLSERRNGCLTYLRRHQQYSMDNLPDDVCGYDARHACAHDCPGYVAATDEQKGRHSVGLGVDTGAAFLPADVFDFSGLDGVTPKIKEQLLIDFDETIAVTDFPTSIIAPIDGAFRVLCYLKHVGYRLCLWTCRENHKTDIDKQHLDSALNWLESYSMLDLFEAINDPALADGFTRDDYPFSRKANSFYTIDDRVNFEGDWKLVERILLTDEFSFSTPVEFNKLMLGVHP